MTELRLTRKAASLLYSATGSIIVSAALVRQCQSVMPPSFTLVVLHGGAGILACPSETLSPEKLPPRSDCIPFIGLPYGLLGIVASKRHTSVVESFLAFCATQAPAVPPSVLWCSRFNPLLRGKISTFIAQLLAIRLQKKQKDLTEIQHQTVHLRRQNEKLWQGFENARRMIAGIGYNTRSICYDLTPGSDSVGIEAGSASADYSQTLPVDLSNFTGISLYVAALAEGKPAGAVTLVIRRRADNRVIGTARQLYKDFATGWQHFTFSADAGPAGLGGAGRANGEGLLQLRWDGAGGPRFAVAEEYAERFGAKASDVSGGFGSSLALRIERGLVEPSIEAGSAPFETDTATTSLSPTLLYTQGAFLGGPDLQARRDAELGSSVMLLDSAGRYLQLHGLKENTCALRLPGVLGVGTVEASTHVTLPHMNASSCLIVLVAGTKGVTAEVVDALIADIGAQGLAATGTKDGLTWSLKTLMPGHSEHLSLAFRDGLTDTQDLLLVVAPQVPPQNNSAWVQWHDVSIKQRFLPADNPVEISPGQTQVATACKRQVRVHKFSEILDQVAYYKGEEAHGALYAKHGFWPIQFSDDVGAIPMQLHPFKEGICAAVLENGLPENVVRLACEIGTGHQQADRFIYCVGVVPKGANRTEAIDAVGAAITAGDSAGMLPDGTEWSAVTISALEKRTLELMLTGPTRRGAEAFFAVMPTGTGNVSYGWCRWYLLSLEMVPQEGAVTLLTSEENLEAAQ
ncbi:MAG: hypothetical protein JKY34_04540 [Kordiimonadaceae bacterium]|nr:hypothetical protein [Kordiimonadaceae bacterium]